MAASIPIRNLWDAQFAREVRDRIFPSARPSIPGLDYYSDWRPARNGMPAGPADYLDCFEMDEGNLGLAIGNVEGVGLHAAFLAASLHSIVHALRFAPFSDLPDFVTRIDELFCEICPDNCHAALFVARYDPVRGRMHYVNAGHQPAFVLRKTASHYRTVRLEAGGTVIGLLHKSPYHQGVLSLNPGDILVAPTDGLCEARNPRGEMWGWHRFLEAIQTCDYQRARDMVQHVFDAVDAFTECTPQSEDMTLWLGRIDEAATRLTLHVADAAAAPVAA